MGARGADSGNGAGPVQNRDLFPFGNPGQHGAELVALLSDSGCFHVTQCVTLRRRRQAAGFTEQSAGVALAGQRLCRSSVVFSQSLPKNRPLSVTALFRNPRRSRERKPAVQISSSIRLFRFARTMCAPPFPSPRPGKRRFEPKVCGSGAERRVAPPRLRGDSVSPPCASTGAERITLGLTLSGTPVTLPVTGFPVTFGRAIPQGGKGR